MQIGYHFIQLVLKDNLTSRASHFIIIDKDNLNMQSQDLDKARDRQALLMEGGLTRHIIMLVDLMHLIKIKQTIIYRINGLG